MHKTYIIVTSSSLNSVNGVSTFIKNLHEHLNIDSEYKGIYHFENKQSEFIDRNIKLIDNSNSVTYNKSPQLVQLKNLIIKIPFLAFLLFVYTYLRPARKVARKIKASSKEAVVISNDMFASFFLQKDDKKLITILHSSDKPINQLLMYFPSIKSTIFEKILNAIFSRAIGNSDAIVTLNSSLKYSISDSFPNKKVFTVFNGVPFSKLIQKKSNSSKNHFIKLVGVGSLTHRKGFDLLIDSLANSNLLKDRIKIDIFGNGPERITLEDKIKSHQLEDSVFLKGNIGNISQILQDYDLFVLTSRDEGLPMAILEACSNQIPIVSTRVGAVPEVFSEEEIIFCEPDAASVMQVLEQIADKKIDLEAYGIKSYAKFQSNLTIDAMWSKYTEIIKIVSEDINDK